ncbi:hypothetical protein UFOVP1169_23 [uncultured Caudovirales phage]|uniref:Uncharacterized protein n=1 Tax=uncultured Caudovirales phage TaxID=2100421 RepID=A0A6J5R2W8_9CAUD|nr:hypothetical protein UFOVP1169_23 [uncultured Caudovirales phage]
MSKVTDETVERFIRAYFGDDHTIATRYPVRKALEAALAEEEEVKVTDDMIIAGQAARYRSYMVTDIYRAMFKARPKDMGKGACAPERRIAKADRRVNKMGRFRVREIADRILWSRCNDGRRSGDKA